MADYRQSRIERISRLAINLNSMQIALVSDHLPGNWRIICLHHTANAW